MINLLAFILIVGVQDEDEYPPTKIETTVSADYLDSLSTPAITDSGRFTHLHLTHPSTTGWVNKQIPFSLSLKGQDAVFDFDDTEDGWLNKYKGDLFKGVLSSEFTVIDRFALIAELDFARFNADEVLALTKGTTQYLGTDELDSGFTNPRVFGKFQAFEIPETLYVSAIAGVKFAMNANDIFASSGSSDTLVGTSISYSLFGGYFHAGVSATVPGDSRIFENKIDNKTFISAELSYARYLGFRTFGYIYGRYVQSPFKNSPLLEGSDISVGASVRYMATKELSLFAGFSVGLTDLSYDRAITGGITFALHRN
ncbi:MAG: hypothetical protein HY606_12060 [Planctomycetes bacterium]|nr:hypothetical protein [Planctomycetota bacterium]